MLELTLKVVIDAHMFVKKDDVFVNYTFIFLVNQDTDS